MGRRESRLLVLEAGDLRSGGQDGWVLVRSLFGVQTAAFSQYPRVGETKRGDRLSHDSSRARTPLMTSSKPEALLPDTIPSGAGPEPVDLGPPSSRPMAPCAAGCTQPGWGASGRPPPINGRGRLLQVACAGGGPVTAFASRLHPPAPPFLCVLSEPPSCEREES